METMFFLLLNVNKKRLCINQGIQERGKDRRERGEWGNVIFRRMSPNIPGNVAKHSRKCCQTFWRISSNILGNFAKHSGEWPQTFRGMLPLFNVNEENYRAESNIHNGALLQKYPTALIRWLFPQKKLHRRFSIGLQISLWLDVL